MIAAPTSVVGLLQDRARTHADAVFLDIDAEAYTYGEIWRRALEVAGGLDALGVAPGDSVVSMQDTHIDAVASWFGTNVVGGVWVGINTALKGEFLRHVVADAGARVAICEADFLPRFEAIAPVAGLDVLLERRSAYQQPYDGPVHIGTPDDLLCLTYTGGTTGPSKGCMISNGYALNLARRGLEQTGRRPDEVNWNPLPMFHLNVLAMTVLATMLVGGTAALAPRFSLSRFWPEIERTGARVVNLIGALPVLIAQQPDSDASRRCFGQIRMVHSVPFPPALQDEWRTRFGVESPGATGYGMTEAFPITYLAVDEVAPPGSAGRVSPDFEVRIVDDDDEDVAPGLPGQIVCRPRRPHVMFTGYWRRPEATLEATRNLWFHTGDIGRFDADGNLWFVDRKHDYLRRRGENISSQELEATFLDHPAIAQVAVHAVPSPMTEDDVKVTAVLHPDAAVSPEELFDWAKEHVPYFALPRYIEFRTELPVTPVGRVHKVTLREQGCTPDTWDREAAGATWERR
jgi:crotonobetaine/carnitine-CoA ligase